MSSIRDLEPAPHIEGIKHFVTYTEVDEILRSHDFRQGSLSLEIPSSPLTTISISNAVGSRRRYSAKQRSNTTNAKNWCR